MKTLPKHGCIWTQQITLEPINWLVCLFSKARESNSISGAKQQDGRADIVSSFKSYAVP